MDYIQELRKLVGKRPLVMVGAAVLLEDGQGRLLLLQRTDNGCWGLPGGALEPGETLEQTARRETLEESGLEVGGLALFGVFSGPELFYRYPNGDEVYNVTVVYTAQPAGGELAPAQAEHRLGRWFAAQELPPPEQISPPVRPVLARWKEGCVNRDA
jgi:ADP-ribose pyrophosphatase YjhB (NUDIX family)